MKVMSDLYESNLNKKQNIVSEAKNQNKMTTDASMRFTETRKARAGVVL